MAVDHIVPRMLLRRFGDEHERLIATDRSTGKRVPTSAGKACRESGFYNIDFDPAYAHLAARNQVEQSLADFEGRASALFDRFAQGVLDLSDQDRFNLMLFVSFQAVRGWAFRAELSELGTLLTKQYLEVELTDSRLRAQLKKDGKAHDAEAVAVWRERLLASDWKLAPSPSAAVQAMGEIALHMLHPRFFVERRVRLIQFNRPVLLISDEPVAMWARPDRDLNVNPLGIGTADVVYIPVDRRHALALALHGEERVIPGDSKKSRLINRAVAAGAHRWIFQHPDDRPVEFDQLPAKPRWGIETLKTIVEPDQIRVQQRLVRQSAT